VGLSISALPKLWQRTKKLNISDTAQVLPPGPVAIVGSSGTTLSSHLLGISASFLTQYLDLTILSNGGPVIRTLTADVEILLD
jgi:hypothetical protein